MPISYSSLKAPLVRFDDSLTDLTTVAPAGTQRYIEENNSLYISDGRGWYKITLINQTPTITTTVPTSYSLEIDSTAITLTIEAEDAENAELVYSYTVNGDLLDTTIVSADNVYTITPGSSATTVDITWTVSDGTNIATAGPTTIDIFIPIPSPVVELSASSGVIWNNVGDPASTFTWVGTAQNIVTKDGSATIYTGTNRTWSTTPSGIVHGDEFTLEYYYFLAGTDNGYWDSMVNIRGASDSTNYGRVWWMDGPSSWVLGSRDQFSSPGDIIPRNTWYHIVIMGSPSLGLKMYRNGSLISMAYDNDYVYGSSGDAITFYFGDALQYFTDFKITKGFVYDTNGFTAPART